MSDFWTLLGMLGLALAAAGTGWGKQSQLDLDRSFDRLEKRLGIRLRSPQQIIEAIERKREVQLIAGAAMCMIVGLAGPQLFA